MVPSSSIVMSAPVSSWIWLIILPLGPMTSPILSTGILTVMIRGAFGDISSGAEITIEDDGTIYIGAGVLLDLVDHLALGADDLADLVHGDLDGDDPRGVRGHLVRRVDRFHHHVEDVEAGVTGLLEGGGQDGGGGGGDT